MISISYIDSQNIKECFTKIDKINNEGKNIKCVINN
jgi:hypothetical protein